MKDLIRNYWIMLIASILLSTSAKSQIRTSSETKAQAETEVRAEQKSEKARQRRTEKASNHELSVVNQKPQYRKTVKRKEKVLLKPIVTREKKK